MIGGRMLPKLRCHRPAACTVYTYVKYTFNYPPWDTTTWWGIISKTRTDNQMNYNFVFLSEPIGWDKELAKIESSHRKVSISSTIACLPNTIRLFKVLIADIFNLWMQTTRFSWTNRTQTCALSPPWSFSRLSSPLPSQPPRLTMEVMLLPPSLLIDDILNLCRLC